MKMIEYRKNGCPPCAPPAGKKKKMWAPYKWLITSAAVIVVFVAGIFVPSPLVKKVTDHLGLTFLDNDAVEVKDTTGMRLPDGSVYEGYINVETKAFHGFGVLRRGDTTFEGEWTDGSLPFGRRTSPDGIYEGDFDESLNRDGYGVMTYSDSYIDTRQRSGTPDDRIVAYYAGHWADNRKQGLARIELADGSMDFGDFRNGVMHRPPGAEYKVGDKIYGIDVSHHNGEIRWDELALFCDKNGNVYNGAPADRKYMQPVWFAYAKATEGATFKDSDYESFSEEAKRHGIARGAYHFLRLGSSLDEQVANFLETARWTPGDMPPALDVELEDEIRTHGEKALLDKTFGWLEAVEREMGVRPVIYTRESIRDKYLAKDPRFGKYECWIARYNTDGPESDNWRMWQFSESGRVSGHDGSMDINIFNSDYRSFRQYLDSHRRRATSLTARR